MIPKQLNKAATNKADPTFKIMMLQLFLAFACSQQTRKTGLSFRLLDLGWFDSKSEVSFSLWTDDARITRQRTTQITDQIYQFWFSPPWGHSEISAEPLGSEGWGLRAQHGTHAWSLLMSTLSVPIPFLQHRTWENTSTKTRWSIQARYLPLLGLPRLCSPSSNLRCLSAFTVGQQALSTVVEWGGNSLPWL